MNIVSTAHVLELQYNNWKFDEISNFHDVLLGQKDVFSNLLLF